jgi:hypothetical protein
VVENVINRTNQHVCHEWNELTHWIKLNLNENYKLTAQMERVRNQHQWKINLKRFCWKIVVKLRLLNHIKGNIKDKIME